MKSGAEVKSVGDYPTPDGWKWKDDSWDVDTHRVCDSSGWEYASNDTFAQTTGLEKVYHTNRRRRLLRTRVRTSPPPPAKSKQRKGSKGKVGAHVCSLLLCRDTS